MNKSGYIIKYFEDTLSEVELKEFNTLLLSDNDFKEEFEFQKELQETLVLNDREQLKEEIQNWDTTIKKSRFKAWFIAASLLILLGTSWQLFFNSPSDSPEELYASYFEPYRNIVQPIVRGEHKEDLQSKAFEAYEAKNYETAILYFNDILKEEPNAAISFYKANTLLQLNKTNEAIKLLEANVKNPDTLQDRNLWYLALAYLKNNNTDATKKTLKQLLSKSKFKTKEATTLIKDLD
ncbi:tetratricopeptide repeat protein [Psychroserpens jangbogonensis]|uniref:tetratricopeptide repeat protein n=1 Tax=Psychroserpens jangbogonensis TaxID=1484460 RepID=UPI00053E6C0D|nr:tetratricopeptide repeat protein [Psychroserpens jangbogonensis]